MRKGKLKYGVYEERYRPTCPKCGKKYPECKHLDPPKRVVVLAGPDRIWMQLNGTNYPAVRFRAFNDFATVEMAMTDTQFSAKFSYVGRYVTEVNRSDIMEVSKR